MKSSPSSLPTISDIYQKIGTPSPDASDNFFANEKCYSQKARIQYIEAVTAQLLKALENPHSKQLSLLELCCGEGHDLKNILDSLKDGSFFPTLVQRGIILKIAITDLAKWDEKLTLEYLQTAIPSPFRNHVSIGVFYEKDVTALETKKEIYEFLKEDKITIGITKMAWQDIPSDQHFELFEILKNCDYQVVMADNVFFYPQSKQTITNLDDILKKITEKYFIDEVSPKASQAIKITPEKFERFRLDMEDPKNPLRHSLESFRGLELVKEPSFLNHIAISLWRKHMILSPELFPFYFSDFVDANQGKITIAKRPPFARTLPDLTDLYLSAFPSNASSKELGDLVLKTSMIIFELTTGIKIKKETANGLRRIEPVITIDNRIKDKTYDWSLELEKAGYSQCLDHDSFLASEEEMKKIREEEKRYCQ